MYSQRDEELHILQWFSVKGEKGKLLDVGAYDGKTFSNTRQLLLNGWRGILVEPSPSVTPALHGLYDGNENVEILELAIGEQAGTFPFQDSNGDAVSSFDNAHVALWRDKAGIPFTEIPMTVITWEDLFGRVGRDFKFINLDAEGWSLDLLDILPIETLSLLEMIIVEFDHEVERVKKRLEPFGFSLHHQTAENLIMVRKI